MPELTGRSYTPPFSYALREDFDYRKYLEQSSHLDRVVIAIDRNTETHIGTSAEIAHRIGGAIETLHEKLDGVVEAERRTAEEISILTETIDEHLTTITLKLDTLTETVKHSVNLLGRKLDLIHHEIMRTNLLLENIINLLKTPDATWAREQYHHAKFCLENGLYQEAIEYLDKAIDGDTNNNGFKIEPTFYFMRGLIRSGGPDSELLRFMNFGKAREDFILCVRYCGKKSNILKSEALTRLAWISYCENDTDDALDTLHEAYSLVGAPIIDAFGEPHKNPECIYLLSKLYARKEDEVNCREYWLQAFKCNSLLSIRSKNDPDFNVFFNKIEQWLAEAAEQKTSQLRRQFEEVVGAGGDEKKLLKLYDKHFDPKRTLDSLPKIIGYDQCSLISLEEWHTRFPSKFIDANKKILRNDYRKAYSDLHRLATGLSEGSEFKEAEVSYSAREKKRKAGFQFLDNFCIALVAFFVFWFVVFIKDGITFIGMLFLTLLCSAGLAGFIYSVKVDEYNKEVDESKKEAERKREEFIKEQDKNRKTSREIFDTLNNITPAGEIRV